MMVRLRQQPSTPMLAALSRRFKQWNQQQYNENTLAGDRMIELLTHEGVVVPGEHADSRNYWLFPIMVAEPDRIIKELTRYVSHTIPYSTNTVMQLTHIDHCAVCSIVMVSMPIVV
jgi:hypothetical protein